MRIISEKPIKEFWEKHPISESSFKKWIQSVREADWDDFSDIRRTFNHADIFKSCVIFDVGGNKFRIIAKVKFEWKVVYIRAVLTHLEYDQEKWRPDCEE